MTSHKISSGVGDAQTNNAEDVAFIQMALKVISKGPYESKGSTNYWAGLIDGKSSYNLRNAIGIFKEAYFSEKELASSSLLREPIGAIPKATSKAYVRLLKALPQKYRNVGYRFGVTRKGIVVFQIASGGIAGKVDYAVADLALPNLEAAKLIRHLTFLFEAFQVVPTIEDIDVGQNGDFHVRIGLSGGRIINNQTAAVKDATSLQERKNIISYFAGSLGKPAFPQARLWQPFGIEKLIFKSKKKYKILKLTAGAKTWIRWHLGAHKTQYQAKVVEKALDIYDRYRIGGALTPEMASLDRKSVV